MQFYKILCKNKSYNPEEKIERQDRRRKIYNVKSLTEEFNNINGNCTYFFSVDLENELFKVAFIDTGAKDIDKLINDYLNIIGIKDKNYKMQEITLEELKKLLHDSEREQYIYDMDEVLEEYGLDVFDGHWRNVRFGENLLEEQNAKKIYSSASEYLSDETLIPEINRIFEGCSLKKAKGNPVHYMIQTDDRDIRKSYYRILLSALHRNKRIVSKRYCFIDVRSDGDFSEKSYEALYKSSFGGAVVVRCLFYDEYESDTASALRETIEFICEIMQKYKNDVLTIFCLPFECTNTKAIFYENMGKTGMVEIREDMASAERSREYLKMVAKKKGIRTDKKLMAKLDDEKMYMSGELNKVFDDWYETKLRNNIYPQYSEAVVAKDKVAKSEPKGSAYDELMNMIGLESAKDVIQKAINYNKAKKLFRDKGMKDSNTSRHMIFTGNPGTAKTTVARLFAQIMRENELLSSGKLIEVGRGDLVGQYVGWTAKIIKKKFKEAEGSVLFIDEAYSLVDDRSGSYGDEAINTIVQEMENHRDDMIVIFAGYPDKMEEFLNKNPGLRSRIAYHVNFDDYNTEELCEISKLMASKEDLILSDEAMDKLMKILDDAHKIPEFGNGRFVRNLLEQARVRQASRLLEKDYNTISDRDIKTICSEDIESSLLMKKEERGIGFCA